jgi:hypothetical protein
VDFSQVMWDFLPHDSEDSIEVALLNNKPSGKANCMYTAGMNQLKKDRIENKQISEILCRTFFLYI